MLRKLNKDELILLIEKINENHKKEIKREIKRIDDEHEIIIDACKELGVQFLKCYVKSCKAMRIRRGGFSERYEDINSDHLYQCERCNQYICDTHSNNCKCFQK